MKSMCLGIIELYILDIEIRGCNSPALMRDLIAVREALYSPVKSKVAQKFRMLTERLEKLLSAYRSGGIEGLKAWRRRWRDFGYIDSTLIKTDPAFLEELDKAECRFERNPFVLRRLKMIREASRCYSCREVARVMKCCHKDVKKNVENYLVHGVYGLLPKRPGPKKGGAEEARDLVRATFIRLAQNFDTVTDKMVAGECGYSVDYVQKLVAREALPGRRQFITKDLVKEVAEDVRREIVFDYSEESKPTIRDDVTLRCEVCGSEKTIKISTLLYGRHKCRCLSKVKPSLYKTEAAVLNMVEKLTGIKLLRNVRPDFIFEACARRLEADGLSMEHRLVVEYNGEQHQMPVNFGGMSDEQALRTHQRTVENDLLKRQACERAGFRYVGIGPVKNNSPENVRQACVTALIAAGVSVR